MSEAKATVLLQHYLKQLKLPRFLREYEKLAAVCPQEQADYETFLLRLAEVEMADRERRAAERRVKAARFPVLKPLDTFDFKAQPALNQELVRQLLEKRQDRELERLQRQLELIVLDELGYVPFAKAGAELLFDVIGRGYERTSLIVTTNLPFAEWTEILRGSRAIRQ